MQPAGDPIGGQCRDVTSRREILSEHCGSRIAKGFDLRRASSVIEVYGVESVNAIEKNRRDERVSRCFPQGSDRQQGAVSCGVEVNKSSCT